MAFTTDEYSIIGVQDAAIQTSLAGTPNTVEEDDLLFVREVAFDPQVQTISFVGDDQKEDRDQLNGFNIVVTLDKFDLASMSTVYGKNKVTTGLPDGVAYRIYFGDAAEATGVDCGIAITVAAKNEVTGASEVLRLVFPVATLKVFQPSNATYNAKMGMVLRFSAKRVTKDIAGINLPSIPAGGAFYYMDILE